MSSPTTIPAPPLLRTADHVVSAPRLWPRLAGGVASGLLAYLAFPPLGAWPLAVPAVALLVLSCRGLRPRSGALVGLAHGLALFLPLVEWTAANAGVAALGALAVLQAVFFAGYGALVPIATRVAGWPLWCAGLWLLQEAARSRIPFGGFPWGRLAFSQADSVLLPLASLGGAPLVSFVVALLAGTLAWTVVAIRARPLVAPVVLVLAVLAAGTVSVLTPTPVGGDPVRVALVQGNVPRLGLGFNDQRAAVLGNHVEATRQLAADVRAGRTPAPALVIWPENASDIDPFTDPAAYDAIDAVVRDIGVPVLVGALVGNDDNTVDNSGIVWDPITGPGERYVKRHPVPFGEYIPFRSLVRRLTSRVDLVPRDFRAGEDVGLLQVGPVRLGDVICFEVAYDGLVRDTVTAGGRLLVVQTNNATFGRSAETEQQLAMGRLRAVEHGRSVLVSATSGISAVIAPDGQVTGSVPVFERGVLSTEVVTRSATTPATRLGAWPEAAAALIGLLGLGAALTGRVRA